jgi:hypothetical protein
VLVVEISLIPPSGYLVNESEAEAARDALWAHASSDCQITHITTTARQQYIDVTIFVRSGSAGPEEAFAVAQKMVSISPAFENWTAQRSDSNSS